MYRYRRVMSGERGHDDFGGLERDARHLLDRRRALVVLGGVGLGGILAACTSEDGSSTSSPTSATSSRAGQASTSSSATTAGGSGTDPAGTDPAGAVEPSPGAEVPDETAGPFPADGTNGPNLLSDGAVVRSDITPSIGGLSGTAEGIPMALQLTVVDAATGDPRPGAAVYVWHCTADGRYSIYEIDDQNYLRGVQAADDAGNLAFTTVFPGCYGGRWPHIHFEVYETLDTADAGSQAVKTSQLALPHAESEAAYADQRYGDSAGNLAQLTLEADGVFADGWDEQLATITGSSADGYTASLLIRI